MIDLVAVGKKISTLRNEQGYSQDVLAERLYVSRQAVSAWENGKSAPTIDNVIELSKLFKVPFEEILCLDEKASFDSEDPYQGHERSYVLRSVIEGKTKVDFAILLEKSTLDERMLLLKALKDGKIHANPSSFKGKLTGDELSFLKNGGYRL
jgi:transcriptional regulator with XRE-family HTH domain